MPKVVLVLTGVNAIDIGDTVIKLLVMVPTARRKNEGTLDFLEKLHQVSLDTEFLSTSDFASWTFTLADDSADTEDVQCTLIKYEVK